MCASILTEKDLRDSGSDIPVQEESSSQVLEDRDVVYHSMELRPEARGELRMQALAWLREIPGVAPFVRDDLRISEIGGPPAIGEGAHGTILVPPDDSGRFYKILTTFPFLDDGSGGINPPESKRMEELLNLIQYRGLAEQGVIPRIESVGINDDLHLVTELQGLPHSFSFGGTDFIKLPPLEKLRLYIEAAEKYYLLHEAGLLHNDVKDANVITNREEVMLIDFGTSRMNGAAQYIGTHVVDPDWRGTDSDVIQLANAIEGHFLLRDQKFGESSGLIQLMTEIRLSGWQSRESRPVKDMHQLIKKLRAVHQTMGQEVDEPNLL